VIITVEAFDWNCPKYITPRFTEREWAASALAIPVERVQYESFE
jgi:hypothetical protein